ncbi:MULTISPECIES: alpha/beta fold hydrolase [Providencia]|uniref:Alpha/beta hydrolase family n=2 Tax=Providencia rustigianii TaxID=158850 RepID=A0A379G629_9GAMM|nr:MULTISPECIES: alpha/beta hydrolase [Providencia]MTC55391.1 alpha/beta hydrolase [Providencia rustigianii]SPY78367.1 Alpha/beta hydrolase family [Providencia rustigianii]SUC36366.1 Alpha/beta hydrolase family [Providencia rustigianii]
MYSNKITNTRHMSMKLSDGRILCWYEAGPEQGFPVVFCTGAGMSGILGFGIDRLDELNIRLITPERAGLGQSTQDEFKSLSRFAQDIQQLLTAQNIQDFSVIGFSQGAVFAMALAYYCSPISLSLVSGQDQFDFPAIKKQLKKDVINMQEQAIKTPDSLSDWLMRNVTSQWLLAFILNCSAEIDQQIYSEEHFLEAYSECMERAFVQGNLGYVQDLLIALQPWQFTPEVIRCPVALWYGELDVSAVHSPDFGKTLAQRFPDSEHFLFSNEGGAVLWTQAYPILAHLKQHSIRA